ncbi:hypothetical protein [Streptomyces sp. NBC_01320]|nr:hypothetical protein OG395_09815 [Streptomyces sp. NBC_01320]
MHPARSAQADSHGSDPVPKAAILPPEELAHHLRPREVVFL